MIDSTTDKNPAPVPPKANRPKKKRKRKKVKVPFPLDMGGKVVSPVNPNKKKPQHARVKVTPSGRVLPILTEKNRLAAKRHRQAVTDYSPEIGKNVSDRIMENAKTDAQKLVAGSDITPVKLMSKEKARRKIENVKMNGGAPAPVATPAPEVVNIPEMVNVLPVANSETRPAQPKAPRYFDSEAYQLGLRKMTQPEAAKMAHDPQLVNAFYAQLEAEKLIPEEAPVAAAKPAPVAKPTPIFRAPANDVKATGSTQTVEVKHRKGGEQANFKARVRANFGGRCAITGDASEVNQGCHLDPFAANKNNNTSNGILLSPTFHMMLDRGLLGIHPDTLKIHFAEDGVFKILFEGETIQPHSVPLDKAALAMLWEKYKGQK